MDRIKRARGLVRAAVTKTIASLEAELVKEAPDRINLQASLQLLEKNAEKLYIQDEKLTEAMLDSESTDTELEAESETIQEYSSRIERAKVKINRILHPASLTPPRSLVSGSEGKKTFKLPKIELKFSGELTEWLGWWAQFEKIEGDDDLHASDKFQYLVQCMAPGSRARDLVERYPQSQENYPKAVAALKERFGKVKLLKQVYVRELINMIIMKSRDNREKSLSTLYDKLESHLRSLESLGVTLEQMVEFLFPMVESCLPEDILIAWQRSSLYGKTLVNEAPPKIELDYLMEFLKQEIDSEEQRILAMAGFGQKTTEKKRKSVFKTGSYEDDAPTASGLFNGDGAKILCIFCEKQHESDKCFRAQSMNLKVKKKKIQSTKACFNCFKIGHQSKKCRIATKCVICGKGHQVLMCPDHSSNKSQTLETSSENSSQVTSSGLNCTSEVILQTLMIKVRNNDLGCDKIVRALIDNGSQRSYILKKTVEHLGLKTAETMTLNHLLFGGSQVAGKVHKVFKIGVCSILSEYSKSMKVLDQAQICNTIPRFGRGPWVSQLREKGIIVSDMDNENPVEVEILIGADNLGSILTGKIFQLSNGLTATETRFGWTLMGEVSSRGSTLAMNVISMYIMSATVAELWKLETIGILDPVESKTRQVKERLAKKHFMETVTRTEDGRYTVCLPWIVGGASIIPNNKSVAENRLVSATNKLKLIGKYCEYEGIFDAWQEEGIISVYPSSFVETRSHYLPHRAVFKPESIEQPLSDQCLMPHAKLAGHLR